MKEADAKKTRRENTGFRAAGTEEAVAAQEEECDHQHPCGGRLPFGAGVCEAAECKGGLWSRALQGTWLLAGHSGRRAADRRCGGTSLGQGVEDVPVVGEEVGLVDRTPFIGCVLCHASRFLHFYPEYGVSRCTALTGGRA